MGCRRAVLGLLSAATLAAGCNSDADCPNVQETCSCPLNGSPKQRRKLKNDDRSHSPGNMPSQRGSKFVQWQKRVRAAVAVKPKLAEYYRKHGGFQRIINLEPDGRRLFGVSEKQCTCVPPSVLPPPLLQSSPSFPSPRAPSSLSLLPTPTRPSPSLPPAPTPPPPWTKQVCTVGAVSSTYYFRVNPHCITCVGGAGTYNVNIWRGYMDIYQGWPNDLSLLSAQTSPCDVQAFVESLAPGEGYYSDPGVSGGWCRSISTLNVAAVRNAYPGAWTPGHLTGKTYVPGVSLTKPFSGIPVIIWGSIGSQSYNPPLSYSPYHGRGDPYGSVSGFEAGDLMEFTAHTSQAGCNKYV